MAVLGVLASCTKEAQFTKARLDFAVTNNTMTKVTTSDVHSAVEEAVHNLPVKIYYGASGKSTAQCDAGDVVTLHVGNVNVGLEYYGDAQESNGVLFYDVPYIYADTTVAFHSYYSELVVRAHFRCSMVVVDPSEVESIEIGGQTLTLADYGSFKAFYVYSDTDGASSDVTVYAKAQTDFTERDVTINPTELEWGKWYLLSPTGITSKDAEVNFDIDGFDEGGRL